MHTRPAPPTSFTEITSLDGLTASSAAGTDAIAAALDHLDEELFAADTTWDDVRTLIIRFDDDMPGIASWHAVAAR